MFFLASSFQLNILHISLLFLIEKYWLMFGSYLLEFDDDEEDGLDGLPKRSVPFHHVVPLPEGHRQWCCLLWSTLKKYCIKLCPLECLLSLIQRGWWKIRMSKAWQCCIQSWAMSNGKSIWAVHISAALAMWLCPCGFVALLSAHCWLWISSCTYELLTCKLFSTT